MNLRVMAAAEVHLNAAYYAQHPPLKSAYGKSQSVIGGKLFSSCRAVFELHRVFENPKQVTLIAMKHLLTICQDKVFASF